MAGTGLYWARGEDELRALAEALGIPVFLNGLGRGCLPADHELAFSRARGAGLKGADVALVIGVPMDFRLGFGGSFGEETKIVRLDVAPNALTANRLPEVDLVGDVAAEPGGDPRGGRRRRAADASLARAAARRSRPRSARPSGRSSTTALAAAPGADLRRARARCSTATRSSSATAATSSPTPAASSTPTSRAAGWTRARSAASAPGPARRSAPRSPIPDRQVCLLLGDGAFGFAGMEFDTMARHGLGVVGVMGNNGIWALEHHPMKFLYGYSVAAELRPETRYDADGRNARLRRRPRARAGSSCGRRWSAPSPRVGRRWSTSSPTPRSSTRANRTWPEGRVRVRSRARQSGPKTNRPPCADGRFKLVPQDGQGYVFRDQLFDGLRRREAP